VLCYSSDMDRQFPRKRGFPESEFGSALGVGKGPARPVYKGSDSKFGSGDSCPDGALMGLLIEGGAVKDLLYSSILFAG
jgi:hypothetical protein